VPRRHIWERQRPNAMRLIRRPEPSQSGQTPSRFGDAPTEWSAWCLVVLLRQGVLGAITLSWCALVVGNQEVVPTCRRRSAGSPSAP
jgi:hypothetical protein